MSTSYRFLAIAFALAGFVSATAGAQEKYAIKVEARTLKRGTSPFTIRAISAPEIGKPGTTREQISKAMNTIGNVGGNSICVDVYGVAEDGASVAEDAVEAIRAIHAVGDDRGVGVVVRVIGATAPKSDKAQMTLARTAAKAFTKDTANLYLFEGDDARELARAFNRVSKHLTVASSRNGDVDVIAPGEKSWKKPQVILGGLPKSLNDDAHFVLNADQQSYDTLEKASALPEESQTWTPDNSGLSPEDKAAGFVALFDGKTFNGWVVLGAKKDAWVIRDGLLSRETSGSQGLRTVRRFKNFHMKWEWSLPKGGNNGVHFRAPRAQRASRVGFEYQMLADYGKAPDKNSTGSIYDVVPPTVNAVKPEGEWNQSEAIFDGTHITYWLNGQKVNDVDMNDIEELRPRLREGFIVLTEHNDAALYRNIRIKELP
ncbi:MAG: DUF1080 domain-containing protein [Candidatus Hydrogenedentes bacterium]|nr:DUF1080 domain-containing protein [Candidatus Hydrogenedentota bacterium]